MSTSKCSLVRWATNLFIAVEFIVLLSASLTTVMAETATDFKCDDLVVAGGGPGGLYSAWRMIETGTVDPSKTCIFEQTSRVGGRMRSVRGEELPEELRALGSQAIDVAAYRAWPALHPFVAAVWAELGVQTGCYSDIAFRTGDCTDECSPERGIHKYLRDKYIPFEDTLNSETVPYNLGPSNKWDVNSTYLSPYDWLYGAYAPPFWADHFEDLSFSEDSAVRWAARDAIVDASRTFEFDGTPGTLITLEELATTGYNSDGVAMTREDYDFFVENDCSTGEHSLTRLSYHDMVVEYANYVAVGLFLGLGSVPQVPVDSDGKQIGFDVIAGLLVEKLEGMGAKLYYRHQVDSTRPSPKKAKWAVVKVTDLESDTEYRIKTEHAVVNIPSEYILSILGESAIEMYGRDDLFEVFRAIKPFSLLKAYPFYENAWWAKVGYTSGRMKTTQNIYHSRYHDGYSACTDDEFKECSGTLLGTYVQGDKGKSWAQPFFPARSALESWDGLHIIRRGEGGPEKDRFLDSLHAQNMESHRDVLAEVGVDTDDILAPDLCLVGDYLGPTAGVHVRPTNYLPPGAIDEAAVEPFPGYNIHLVNEAYGIPSGWLQSSLYSAERMLHHYYGLGKADWFNDAIFEGFDSDNYYKSVIGNSNGNGK